MSRCRTILSELVALVRSAVCYLLVEERLVYFVNQLPTLMQKIVRLLRGGATTGEIAHRLGVEPRWVYRAMEWLKRKIRE